MSFLKVRRVQVLTLVLAVAGLGLAVYFWLRPRPLPGPETSEYREYQRAFQVGVAAMDAGREELALAKFDLAIDLIPSEPAAWANRGLVRLRANALDHAAKDLKQAHQLAPDNAEIEAMLGLLAKKQGRLPDAVGHLRKAVARNPRDTASLFLLAEVISEEGGAGADAEYQGLMEQILMVQPNNLPVLLERGITAARRKDKAAFDETLERLGRLQANWRPISQQSLDDVRKAAPNEVIAQLQVLDNVLKAERGYSRDSFAIRPQPGIVGTPLTQFVRLTPTRPTPAPPDHALAFSSVPLDAPGAKAQRWDVIRAVWLMNEEQRAALTEGALQGGAEARPADIFKPAIVLASAREVRRLGADQVMPFPSGPKEVPPTQAGVLPVDWDNDLRLDLVLAGAGGVRFWQRGADGKFTNATPRTRLPAKVLDADYYGAWAADLEMDGDLDIIIAPRSGSPLVLRNNGDGTFQPIETFAGVKDVRAFAWADLDNDGTPDAAFLDAAGKLYVFANDRAGQFSAWPLPADIGTYLALTAADVNNDGVLDLVAVRSNGAVVRLSDKDRRGSWEVGELARWAMPQGATIGAVTVLVEDMDNNGAIDIVVSGPNQTQVFLGDERGGYSALANAVPQATHVAVDWDRDGMLDLVGLVNGQPTRALNQSKLAYHRQEIWALANPKAGDQRVNSFAIGGEVEVRAGSLVQKQPINAPVVHLGLGEQTAADVARIVWPNGIPQWEFDLPADRVITAAQRLSGSCPFLFTHDGLGMRFAGDFMWGTPLGMYVNGQNIGNFPQTTEWLKIPGPHLVPRNGEYDVRVHANLWEADYFDQLALIVVDHPADTEIHVDERFFLTPTPPRLHVTTPAKPVKRAWDHRGVDATEEVRAIDGRYLDRTGRGRFQGVTDDHWVEVDLGDDAPTEGPVLLIARGWLHPTNSSINVALSQGKHAIPRPLMLEVPDGKGGWKAIGPPLGFPAGKDKTMLIPLDGIAGKGVCRRLRLHTNMEIFWDFLGYATELDPKLARLQRPPMAAADLRYRGIVAMTQKNSSSPEVPVYDKVIRSTQPWRDQAGYYTRFGDVRELLAKVDDRYVILNAGDEIALRFPVPQAPPAGWQRDFIWECDGWTRDADLNTRHGDTVHPLPAHGVNPDARPRGRLEDDPVYRRFPLDWRSYHTRFVTGDDFARGLRR